jgi:integrase
VWEYRYRDHSEPGSPMRQLTLSTLEFPTKTKALEHLQALVLELNGPQKYRARKRITMGTLIDRFMTEERIEEIVKQKPGDVVIQDGMAFSTASGYRSYLKKHIRPKWADTELSAVTPQAVNDWLKSLPLAVKTQAQIRALVHLLFEKAMLWGLMETQRNPIELVKLKGTSKRTRRPYILLPEQFGQLVEILPEPYRTMSIVAMCTGLRVSEVLALRWEDINFQGGVLLVQRGSVGGRIGKVKTEASNDFVPLDPVFVQVLKNWKGNRVEGLVFPSHITGRTYHAGIIQRQILRERGKEVGIPNLGWHTFRHTYRALLDETNAPVGVQQKLMRHANISTTMNIYGNSTLRAKAEANSKVVEMLIPRSAKPLESATAM